jgi:hypothetical protein
MSDKPSRDDARETIRFVVHDVLSARGGRVEPSQAVGFAEDVTKALEASPVRWALAVFGASDGQG